MSKRTEYRSTEGEYFHVYNRGVKKSDIFDSKENYSFFLTKLSTVWIPCRVDVISFCLMPNHFHFILKQNGQESIAGFMKALCSSYAKALNNQRGSSGHVFESKYKIKLIDSEDYLIWLSRYVHRNPKEGGLVRECLDCEFSSFKDYVQTKRHRFISPGVVVSQFSSAEQYRRYVEDDGEVMPKGAGKFLVEE
jgi:REP element-mobilizing transposase RayT